MKLIITRHGETEENKAGIIQGHLPGHLSATGIKQAEKVALRLKDEKIDFIYSSDLARASDTAKKMNLKSMRFFGFDAFKGLPEGTDKEHDVLQKGFYACSFEKMKECLKRRNINPNDITWINGWYDETLNNKTIEKHNIKKIGIVFVDCDTYSSSKAVLDFLTPLITEPVIFCFDDWKLYNMDVKGTGEYRSFNEFLEKNIHLEVKEIKSYNRKSKSFLIKLKK